MKELKLSVKYFLFLTSAILALSLINPMFLWLWILAVIFVYIKSLFYKVYVYDDKIVLKTGILIKEEKTILVKEINNLEKKANFIQEYFKCADVTVFTGNDHPLVLDSIENYDVVFTKIKI